MEVHSPSGVLLPRHQTRLHPRKTIPPCPTIRGLYGTRGVRLRHILHRTKLFLLLQHPTHTHLSKVQPIQRIIVLHLKLVLVLGTPPMHNLSTVVNTPMLPMTTIVIRTRIAIPYPPMESRSTIIRLNWPRLHLSNKMTSSTGITPKLSLNGEGICRNQYAR